MKKWMYAAIPAVIIGAYTAVAVYTGSKAEEALKAGIVHANAGPEWQFEWARYDRGLFRSKAVLDVIFTPNNGENMFRHSLPITVVHGPLLLDGTFLMQPAMFGMKSAVISRDDWPQDLKTFLADERVHFEAVFGWNNNADVDFTIEQGELELSVGKMDLKEMDISFHYDNSSKAIRGAGQWPGLTLNGMMGDVSVQNWQLRWDGVQHDMYTGTGEGRMSLDEIKVSQGGVDQFIMKTFVVDSKQGMSADLKQLNGEVKFAVDQINAQGQSIVAKLNLDVQFDKLSVAGMKAMNDANKDPAMAADPLAMLNTVGPQLLEFGPEIKAQLRADEVMRQPMTVNANLVLPPMPNGMNPDWMQQLVLSMDGKVPMTLIGMAMPGDIMALLAQGDTDEKGTSFKVEWKEGQLWINANPYMPGADADEDMDPDMMDDMDAMRDDCLEEEC